MAASSLLVYQHIVKGTVGEAFVAAAAATSKYQAANKDIIAAYGRFYNLLITAGYESWQDYVLDQVRLHPLTASWRRSRGGMTLRR